MTGAGVADVANVWQKLRRRKVVQWGLAYAAGAWGLLQGLQFLAETYEWSTRVLKVSTLAFLVGLPIVLVLAWYHGDRGEQRIRGTELLIVTLLFLVGGGLLWRFDRTRDSTVEAGGTAAQSDSPVPFALHIAGKLSSVLGRWDEAERQFRLALVRDPLDPYTLWNLGTTYYFAGRFAEAETTYRKLLDQEPGFLWTRGYLGKTLLAQGKPEAALALVRQIADDGERLLYLPVMLQAAGRNAEAAEAFEAQIAHWAETGAFYIAATYAYRRDHDLALHWLERAYRQKDVALTEILGEHLFKSMRDDPRYKAFLRKMKLPEWPTQAIAATGK